MSARTIELPFEAFTVGNIRKPRTVKGVSRTKDGVAHPVTVVLMPADRNAPAKTARPATKKAAAPKAPAKSKVLSKGVAKKIRQSKAGAQYRGMTPAQMIDAGLKGYHLPTGAVRSAIANG